MQLKHFVFFFQGFVLQVPCFVTEVPVSHLSRGVTSEMIVVMALMKRTVEHRAHLRTVDVAGRRRWLIILTGLSVPDLSKAFGLLTITH